MLSDLPMPTVKRRKHVPLIVKLHAALHQLGFEPHEVELDHDPALWLRDWDPDKGDTIPPANDPKFLIWRPISQHREKTFGRGGEKRITTAGSDIHAIAKARRVNADQEEFRRTLLAKTPGQKRKRSGKIPSRPFPKRKKS